MPNHLIHENSPYLLQHADNPVDWYPWGEEALTRARAENKPIFLSIGYAACHWCHVMEHESFEDNTTAALMNENFINIKIDREERPDLDSIYMSAVVALTGQGGWPMSVFLTPDLQPFYGGTYFPPVRRYNMPSFREVLQTMSRLWMEDRNRLLESGAHLSEHLKQTPPLNQSKNTWNGINLDQAAAVLAQGYDWKNGGWGKAPKFPQPMTIEFLLRKATRGDMFARDMAVHALQAMAKGGMYDVVGGGFARYSTDDSWHTPHFEKMLYDNAQLALVYLHGWLVTSKVQFRRVCEETLDFVLREMTHPQGGFYSSLDADSEGEEGKFYVWTPQQIGSALDAEDAAFIMAAYNITQNGNFEGKNVLQRTLTDEQLAERFNLPVTEIPLRLKALHEKLLIARLNRVRPGTDNKVLTAWNAFMLSAFAEAARYLKRADYLAAAQQAAHFLLDNLFLDGRLLRSWRDGNARHNAYLEDYAALILGLLALYQSDADSNWYSAAIKFAEQMLAHFTDPNGGFFDTGDDHEILLLRPKDIQDNATPSGNALAACVLLQLAAYQGRSDWRTWVENMLGSVQEVMIRYPTAFAQWLQAADFAQGPVYEVAIIGDQSDPQMQAFLDSLWQVYRPRLVGAVSHLPVPPDVPALLHGRTLQNALPTAYVCQGFTCLRPTNSPEQLVAQLAEKIG